MTVNGETVTFPREKVGADDVVRGRRRGVELRELRYFLVNKPRGVASTRRDPHAERVIVDLVPDGRTLFPVGRLDVDTTGLIILTNDGALANRLMHPRYGVPKTYVARVRGKVGRRALGALRQGVELEDGLTAPAEVRLKKQSAKTALVEVTIHEGRKRQVGACSRPWACRWRSFTGAATARSATRASSPAAIASWPATRSRRCAAPARVCNPRSEEEVEGEPINLAGDVPAASRTMTGHEPG